MYYRLQTNVFHSHYEQFVGGGGGGQKFNLKIICHFSRNNILCGIFNVRVHKLHLYFSEYILSSLKHLQSLPYFPCNLYTILPLLLI